MVGINRFGESGKGPAVMAHLGITADNVVAKAMASWASNVTRASVVRDT